MCGPHAAMNALCELHIAAGVGSTRNTAQTQSNVGAGTGTGAARGGPNEHGGPDRIVRAAAGKLLT